MSQLETYVQALSQAPFAVLIFDRHGAVHYLNPSFRFLCTHLFNPSSPSAEQTLKIPEHDELLSQWPQFSASRDCEVKSTWLRNPYTEETLDGTVRLLDMGDAPRACFYAQDISELRSTYRSLRSTMETFHAIFNLAPDVIALTRMTDNVVMQVNKAYEKLTGYDSSSIIGKQSISAHVWKDPNDRSRLIGELMANGRVENMLVEMKNAEGGPIHVSVSAVLLQLHGVPHMLSIFRDISMQVKNEQDLRELNQQLEERVKERTQELSRLNQELESYIYTLSHDLRSPIRAVNGFSALLREQSEGELSEDNRTLLSRIENAAQRMMQMTDDLLRLAKLSRSAVERQPICLANIAQDIHKDLQSHYPQRQVSLICAGPLEANADPQLMRHVLENLLSNAWKYSATRAAGEIRFWTEPGGNQQCRYLMQDNGVGFDPAYAQRLFQPFYRLHKDTEFPGTGIGLATVARIISAHGGQVGGSATPDGGALFWFTLPQSSSELLNFSRSPPIA